MAKSYSTDLCERVIADIEDGHSRHAAARAFDVSASFAIELMARWGEIGSSEPARRGCSPGDGKLAPHHDFLLKQVEEEPDITMPGSNT